MIKLKKNNLFLEFNDENLFVVVGEYDDELNFKIIEKEIFSPSGFKNGKIVNLDSSVENLKKIISKIEDRSKLFFSDINVIINQTDFDCLNVSGFKKLNGNQILSDDISYILNNLKSKIEETEKNKKIIHLFNTKYLLDNKTVKNLPIGLHGDFYSHQLTFFMINNNDLKNIESFFNRCNLSVNKIILKSFTDGIKIINKEKKDTFIKINLGKDETQVLFFYESAFCFSQRFNFGSDIILKDISKVCSLEIQNVHRIISESSFEISDQNMYVNKKYLGENNFRKISLKNIIEISSARIEEIVNIIFNKNKHLKSLKNKEIPLYFDFIDKNIIYKFKDIFEKQFVDCQLNFDKSKDEDPFASLRIFGELLSKGWVKEAIPFINKKKTWISRIFSGFFE